MNRPVSIGRHAGGVLIVPDAERHIPIMKIRKVDQCPITEGIAAKHLDFFGLVISTFFGT